MTLAVRLIAALTAVFVLIQLVPYGRAHTNPPPQGTPRWDSAATEALARRACFDCHSRETRWPWYSHVAPASWLLQHHVDEGREHLDFTAWDLPQRDADEMEEAAREGWMPLANYTYLHPEARLTDAETRQLADGLARTFAQDPPPAAVDGSDPGDSDHGDEARDH